jgi:nucleoside-diphosphate-sugar epimerase
MGYVGPSVIRELRRTYPDANLIGFDTGFFAHCLTSGHCLPETILDAQHFGDIRDFPVQLLDGVEAIVHLAAVSNDPIGNRFEAVTMQTNFEASVSLADIARTAGVRSFVFASSCSIYGFAESGARKESDALNPLTAYARSKIATEQATKAFATPDFSVTALRFATACGMSDRLRLDLVLNDFVAASVANGEIKVLSDGTPWRPLIDVKDMARAAAWATARTCEVGGAFLAVNIGSDEWNFTVRDLAEAVARVRPNARVIINENAEPDRRSYKVDFALFRELAPAHQPQVTLDQAVRELQSGLENMGFVDEDFRNSDLMRLKALQRHIDEGRLTNSLRWSREALTS